MAIPNGTVTTVLLHKNNGAAVIPIANTRKLRSTAWLINKQGCSRRVVNLKESGGIY